MEIRVSDESVSTRNNHQNQALTTQSFARTRNRFLSFAPNSHPQCQEQRQTKLSATPSIRERSHYIDQLDICPVQEPLR